MSTLAAPADPPVERKFGHWCWINVGVAALVMVATLPGRSHGLGLVTEPLLKDFQLDEIAYGHINLWATLLGALFCLPCGWLIDRFGLRSVLAGVVLLLGLTVLAMSATHDTAVLAGLILLTRGFGQSALSVVSLGIVGKTPFRRREVAMGVFSVLMGIGFAIAVQGFKAAEESGGLTWRQNWAGIGWVLLFGVLPLCWVLLREPTPVDQPDAADDAEPTAGDATLAGALRTPAFWAFALACSLFLLISSGFSLYGQLILEDFGFSRSEFLDVQSVSFLLGIAFNLLFGWLAQRYPMGRVLGAGLFVLAVSLATLPWLRTVPQLYLFAIGLAVGGGAVTVIFFAIWRHLFGRSHLGQIQGAAQMLTVLASGLSQLLFPVVRSWAGSYGPLFRTLAVLSIVLGVCVWCVPLPRRVTNVTSPGTSRA